MNLYFEETRRKEVSYYEIQNYKNPKYINERNSKYYLNNDDIIMDAMLITVMNISDVTVDFSTMNIDIEKINLESNVATVDATMIMNCSSGEYRDKVVVRMSKEADKWYITGIES